MVKKRSSSAKHKPPSRIRYEKSHPTISFRLDEELKSRLREVLKKESFGSFIKEALGKREREKETLESKYDLGYSKGYDEGYNEAVRIYGIYTHCVICGEKMLVGKENVKKEIDKFLRDRKAHHTQCLESLKNRRMD